LVLEEFANKMALRTGGLSGINKLIDSNALGTIELSTGFTNFGTARLLSMKANHLHTNNWKNSVGLPRKKN
jgi:hypothetical protein